MPPFGLSWQDVAALGGLVVMVTAVLRKFLRPAFGGAVRAAVRADLKQVADHGRQLADHAYLHRETTAELARITATIKGIESAIVELPTLRLSLDNLQTAVDRATEAQDRSTACYQRLAEEIGELRGRLAS